MCPRRSTRSSTTSGAPSDPQPEDIGEPCSIEAAGIDRVTYVEIVGVVSRATAIDTFERGVGRQQRELPEPVPGDPTNMAMTGVRHGAGWVPTAGAIGPVTALSAVPDEATAQAALHEVLYLSYEQMCDLDAQRELHRTQMELIAARVSWLNDCEF